MLSDSFLEKCIARYSCQSCAKKELADIDVIIPISYCATPGGLTAATRENFISALRYAAEFPHAVIAFCNAGYVFAGAEEVERSEKWKIIRESAISQNRILEARLIANSIQEAQAIRTRLNAANTDPRRILLITGTMHAPSAWLIWHKVFPGSEIFIRCIPYRTEYQSNHPVIVQHSAALWFAANLLRHILILLFGISFVRRFHHWVSTRKSPAK